MKHYSNRCTLAVTHLPQFEEYLVENDWAIQFPKGKYEVLRATKQGRKYPVIVYRRETTSAGKSLVHLSVLDRDMGIVREFLKKGESV